MSHIGADLPKRILRSEMVKRGIGYDELSSRLDEAGTKLSAAALRNKVSRGGFTAEFFLKALVALEVETLRLTELH